MHKEFVRQSVEELLLESLDKHPASGSRRPGDLLADLGTYLGPTWDLPGTYLDLSGPIWELGPTWDLPGTYLGPTRICWRVVKSLNKGER